MKSSHKFLVLGSTLVVLTLGLTSWFMQAKLRTAARYDVAQSLTAVLDTTHQTVKSWVKEQQAKVAVWANTPEVRTLTGELLKLPSAREALETSAAQQQFRKFLQPLWAGEHYQGFYIIGPDYLNLASSREESIGEINSLIKTQKFYQKIFAGAPAISLPEWSNAPLMDSDGDLHGNLPTMFVGAPVRNNAGDVIAVLAFQINPADEFTGILQQGRIGNTGETYAFDKQGRLISKSRFIDELRNLGLLEHNQSTLLNIEIRDPGAVPERGERKMIPKEQYPLTRMAASALAGESGVDLHGYRDYRGVYVVGVWRWDEELGLGVATEQDKKEAYQSIQNTQAVIISLTFLAIVLSLGLVMLQVFYKQMKVAGQQKSDSEARLRSLLESVGEGVFGVDLEGKCTFINPAGLRLLGYKSVSELVGKNMHAIIHHTRIDGSACPDTDCRVYGAYRLGKSFYVDDEILWRADGASFEVEYRSNPVYRDGRINGSVASFTDITSRRQAEHALRQSETKYRQIFNSILDVYAEIALDGAILEVSPSVSLQTGYSREELLGRSMGDFFASTADREKLLSLIKRDGIVNDYETMLIDKDGTARPFSFTGKVVTDETGQAVKLAGVMRDIAVRKHSEDDLRNARDELERRVQERTAELEVANEELRYEIEERKQAENTVRERERFIQTILDSLPDNIAVINQQGIIMSVNEAWRRFARENVNTTFIHSDIGDNYLAICLEDNSTHRKEAMQVVMGVEEVLNGKRDAFSLEYACSVRGEQRWIIMHVTPFTSSYRGVVISHRDTTKRRQAEEQARQHQAEIAHMARLNIMGEMATGMAHELNQPLSAIVTYSDAALRMATSGIEQTDKLQEAIKGARSQAQRAAEIIRHLRQLVSKQAPQRKKINLNELIVESVKLIRADAKRYHIHVKQELDETVPLIMVDPVQIEQVILNLIRNSVEAIQQANSRMREITIRSMHNNKLVQVEISDTGPGLDEQAQREVFKPFMTTKKGAGMGMGLSISRSIIEAHDGSLWVESVPGHGASFCFTLPRN
ncbi:MAG: PAS domain S-box protein [Gammaproteobacteria bacterium]|nr:PAS domain S-box protein [Gammaproteobacteria bacterium]